MFEIWTVFVGFAEMTERQKDAGCFGESYLKGPLRSNLVIARGVFCQFMSIDNFFLAESQSGLFQR